MLLCCTGDFAVAVAYSRTPCITSSAIGGYWVAFNSFYLLASIAITVWLLSEVGKPGSLLLLVFIVMLPLVNAFMDWLSLGFTRGFLYAIHQHSHNGMKALLFVFFDVGLALLFLIAILWLTVLLLAGMNTAATHWNGQTLMDLQILFNGLAENPLALEYAWIHFTIADAAAMMIFPNQCRQSILAQWETRGDAQTGALWYVTIVPAPGLAAPLIALWLLHALLSAHGGRIGYCLLNWAQTLSTAFDSLT